MAHKNIFCNSQMRIGCRMLIYCRNSGCLGILRSSELHFFAVQEHFTLFCFMYTGNYLDKRTFSGAVFAHERMNLAGFQLKLHIIQCLYTRKNLCNSFKLKNIFRHGSSPPFSYLFTDSILPLVIFL